MDRPHLSRRTVALVAAYALALQGLLLAFVPGTPAGLAGSFAAFCAHDGSGNGSAPDPASPHDLPCAALCAALAHGMAGALPTGPAAVAVVLAETATPAIANDWVPPRRVLSGPQIPRGPPLA